MDPCGVLVTFDDGVDPGSITDRDYADFLRCLLDPLSNLPTHDREAAVPSGPAEAGQKLVLEALRIVGD